MAKKPIWREKRITKILAKLSKNLSEITKKFLEILESDGLEISGVKDSQIFMKNTDGERPVGIMTSLNFNFREKIVEYDFTVYLNENTIYQTTQSR